MQEWNNLTVVATLAEKKISYNYLLYYRNYQTIDRRSGDEPSNGK